MTDIAHDLQTLDHEVEVPGTGKSIGVARSDQGSRIIELAFANPGLGIHVWEGLEGDDIESFRARWNEFVEDASLTDFPYVDARYGQVCFLQRAAIPLLVAYSLQYRRREDTRAPIAWRPGPGGLPVPVRR